MKKGIVLGGSMFVLAALTACASTTPGVSSKVAAAEVSLTTVENLASIYTHLPRCAPTTAGPCSDQSTVDKIKALDMQAYNAVMAARQNEALLSAALTAITNLQSAIPQAK